MMAVASSNRRAEFQMPIQPSPRRPGAAQRGIGATSDDDGDGWLRHGQDQGVVQVEELAVVSYRSSCEQRPEDAQGFVRAAAASTWIDAAVRARAVLATDTDAEDRRPGYPNIGRELTGHQHGMTQGQQIHRHERSKRGVGCEFVGRTDQPVESGTDDEADVVAAHNMIDTGHGDRTSRC